MIQWITCLPASTSGGGVGDDRGQQLQPADAPGLGPIHRRSMRLRAGRSAGPYLARMQGRAPHAARQARSGLGSASRPAYSSLRCKAAAHTACRRVMRLRPGLSGRPSYLAAVQGRVPRGSPSPRRPRLGHPACLHSSPRCEAAAQAAYRRTMRFRAGLPACIWLLLVQLTCSTMLLDCPLRRSSVAVHAVTVQRNRFTTM